jgi:tetrahydromethanopterin S-methyltransferase subunit G
MSARNPNPKTQLIGVTISEDQYNAIVARLAKLESVQDFIRKAIDEKVASTKVTA